MRTLLLGLGNDILSDDAIGLRVTAAVRERAGLPTDLVIMETAEMGLALLDHVVGFDSLVLVDAVETGQAPPGTVHEFAGDQLSTLPNFSPHFVGVGETLALGRKLGLAVPTRVVVFAIEVADPLTVGTRLSPELEAAFPGLVEKVAQAAQAEASA